MELIKRYQKPCECSHKDFIAPPKEFSWSPNCPTCNDTGWILTEEGEDMVNFIEQNFHVVLNSDSESGQETITSVQFDPRK